MPSTERTAPECRSAFGRLSSLRSEKKDRATIDARDLAALQTVAAALLAMDPKLLEKAVAEGELEEICREEKSPAR